jgi:hypothetical protein
MSKKGSEESQARKEALLAEAIDFANQVQALVDREMAIMRSRLHGSLEVDDGLVIDESNN